MFKSKIHPYRVQVYMEDTDANQIVYQANYLKYAERARSDLLHQVGIYKSCLYTESHLRIVVYKAEIDYFSPAFLDDELSIATRILEMSHATVIMQQDVLRFSTLLARVLVKLAMINDQSK